MSSSAHRRTVLASCLFCDGAPPCPTELEHGPSTRRRRSAIRVLDGLRRIRRPPAFLLGEVAARERLAVGLRQALARFREDPLLIRGRLGEQVAAVLLDGGLGPVGRELLTRLRQHRLLTDRLQLRSDPLWKIESYSQCEET